jgi:hypothetical protein
MAEEQMTGILFKYYGVDWVLFALIVIHLWMLGNKWKWAFLVGFSACLFGLTFGILVGSLASIIMNIVFAFMHLRAFWKWSRKNGLKGPCIAEGTWPDE